jgi:hypothetical protein
MCSQRGCIIPVSGEYNTLMCSMTRSLVVVLDDSESCVEGVILTESFRRVLVEAHVYVHARNESCTLSLGVLLYMCSMILCSRSHNLYS